jgi:hypothetical protein
MVPGVHRRTLPRSACRRYLTIHVSEMVRGEPATPAAVTTIEPVCEPDFVFALIETVTVVGATPLVTLMLMVPFDADRVADHAAIERSPTLVTVKVWLGRAQAGAPQLGTRPAARYDVRAQNPANF